MASVVNLVNQIRNHPFYPRLDDGEKRAVNSTSPDRRQLKLILRKLDEMGLPAKNPVARRPNNRANGRRGRA